MSQNSDHQPAQPAVVANNAAVRERLPFDDTRDLDDVRRGFLGTARDPLIRNADGAVVWDLEAYGFLAQDCPDTANPSLWRQSRLCSEHGLFEVVEGIYQIRGFDLSNMTVVEIPRHPHHRPAAVRRNRLGGPRALPQPPRRAPRDRSPLHAQPRRSLRWRARSDHR